VSTVSDNEEAYSDGARLGIHFIFKVEYAYTVDAPGKPMIDATAELAGRELHVNVLYPAGNEHDHHALAGIASMLVSFGRYGKAEIKQLMAQVKADPSAKVHLQFDPGLFTGRRAYILSDPPPADGFPENVPISQEDFGKVVSGEISPVWGWDRKNARAQAALAANSGGSSAGRMVVAGPAAVVRPNIASAASAVTAGPATFASAPPGPAAAPAGGAASPPPTWNPGLTATPPPTAPVNGSGPTAWAPTAPTPAAAPPATRAW